MKLKNLFILNLFLPLILLLSFNSALAQTEMVSIFKYVTQPGFRKSKLEGKTEFYFKKSKKWVIISLFDISASQGNPVEDSQNDWNDIVLKNYKITSEVVTESREQDGWKVVAKTATGSIFQKINLSLITFSCSSGHASILLTNNDFENALDKEIGSFIGSISVVSTAEAIAKIKPANANTMVLGGGSSNQKPIDNQLPGNVQVTANDNLQPSNQGTGNKITVQENNSASVAPNPYHPPFPTPAEQVVKASIMMNEGWFVEATNDYMQYTTADMKVVEYFLVDVPYPNKDQYWSQHLSKYFTTERFNTLESSVPSYFSIEFAWCNATYLQNGKTYFVAWLVDHNIPAAFVAITSSESVFRKYFPADKNLGEMQRFNNFPVNMQAIQGEWTESSSSGAQMYQTSTGNYAGMALASASNSFTFSGNNFSFFTQGSTGMVGSSKVFQEEEKGNFILNNYTLVTNITSRTDQMTNTTTTRQEQIEYAVAFKYAKNSSVLFMQNKRSSGLKFNLVRK